MWEDVCWAEQNRLMYGLAFSCHSTSECHLAGSPFIKCTAGFPHQWHPENTTKIFGSIPYTAPYHLLKERRIIHTWSSCLWCEHSYWVYSVCEWQDWILQWERKIIGPCGQVLLMPRISHLDILVIVKSQQFINKKPEASIVMEHDTSEHGYLGYYWTMNCLQTDM